MAFGPPLTDTSPASLAAAAQGNLMALNRLVAGSPHAETVEAPGFLRLRTAIPHPNFNFVLVSAPPDGSAEERARAAVEYFRSRGVKSFFWWLDPGVPAGTWSPILSELGFVLDAKLPGMAMVLDDPAAGAERWMAEAKRREGIEIRRVETSAELRRWTELFAAGYGLPPSVAPPLFEIYDGLHGPNTPLESYFAYRDGKPVATSTVFYGQGVAGVYDVATLPEARGKGIGGAVTMAPLHEARSRGYRVGVLQSSDMGLRVYERLGFRTVCTVDHFVWRAGAEAPALRDATSRPA